MKEDYLRILGLSLEATDSEIKRAYRRLVREFHPDINSQPGAYQQFLKIQEAYQKLISGTYISTLEWQFQREDPIEAEKRKRRAEAFARRKEKEKQHEIYMQGIREKFIKYSNPVVFTFCLISAMVIFDHILPWKARDIEINRFEKYPRTYGGHPFAYGVTSVDGEFFYISLRTPIDENMYRTFRHMELQTGYLTTMTKSLVIHGYKNIEVQENQNLPVVGILLFLFGVIYFMSHNFEIKLGFEILLVMIGLVFVWIVFKEMLK